MTTLDIAISALLWLSIVGCAIMAGVYFAFSTFIMRAFGELEGAGGAAAMLAINRGILRSPFLPVFMGSTLTGLALAAIGIASRGSPGALAMAAGGSIYVLGMFGVTMARNVPLNNRLVAAPNETWVRYLTEWTRWNHVRTFASLAGLVLFVLALAERSPA